MARGRSLLRFHHLLLLLPPFSTLPVPLIVPGLEAELSRGAALFNILIEEKRAFAQGRGTGGGEEEACPRATDRPLLINFGSDRLA